MCDFNLSILNLNGARADFKRAALFKLMEIKRINVMFVQETHSTVDNECEWRQAFNGEVILSHKSSLSGGVGILFSRSFLPVSFILDEIIPGGFIKVTAVFEHVKLVFLNVYAPTNRSERMAFLNILSDTVKDLNDTDFMFLGGDFNCTEVPLLDRNHVEPHPASSSRIRQLIETHQLSDVWRSFNSNLRQYTWSHSKDNTLSLARLDRLYVFNHHVGIFKGCHIQPVGFSDHSLVSCSVFIKNIRLRSAYWHFNTALLNNQAFRTAFKYFWVRHRGSRPAFPSTQQWWDVGKTHIKLLCQQFTRNATRDLTRSLRNLEFEAEELQSLAEASGNQGHLGSLKRKKAAIANLLGVSAQGALVRCRFLNVAQMDAPSRFFFGLEQKNGQRKIIHCLRTGSGSDISDSSEIRKFAAGFYRDLFRSECSDNPDVYSSFLAGLPQVSSEDNDELTAELTLEELYAAMMSLQSGKAPGMDGLPVDFYKSFWSIIGPDLLEVMKDSLKIGRLPLSCRRAVITLLPKKGDLQQIKNWRPVSLLCTDYKILSKALALRLREVMASIIHPDQTYCVPGRLISDNVTLIRDVLALSSELGLDTGLISIDQEKAFDRVEHQYLWRTLAGFGFHPGFIAKIRALYTGVASVLKINGGLSAPFDIERGVRQGCPLSGMLYSVAIEPLLHKLRQKLTGVYFPRCPVSFKMSVYADDLIVILNSQKDIDVLTDTVNLFGLISSAKVNWGKSEAVVVGERLEGQLSLPAGLTWKKGGLKYLGIFLGDETTTKKNWDNVLESVEGRLKKWRWLLPKMSYRGRVLIANNLVSSSLWHRMACMDPPASLLPQVQRLLVDFIWDRLHWVPQSVLFLPKEEGGQGLVHLASRGAAFRLQFIQRFLTGSGDALWKTLSQCILNHFNSLGMDFNPFLMDSTYFNSSSLPVFYKSIFNVWSLVKKQRQKEADSLHWLLQEPVVHGTILDLPSWAGPSLVSRLQTAGVFTLGQVVELAGPQLQDPAGLASRLGLKSSRVTKQLLDHWRGKLSRKELLMLKAQDPTTCTRDPFPLIQLTADLKDSAGLLLDPCPGASLQDASGKTFYQLMVKTLNRRKLSGRLDTPWRSKLGAEGWRPVWRSLYSPPLTKRHGDLQWRILHGAVAVNSFISVVNEAVEDKCPFCRERETVFHCFTECQRLSALFLFLQTVFTAFTEVFTKHVFIAGFKHTRQKKQKSRLLNFVLGQAKMAVYVSRRKKVEEGEITSPVHVCVGLIRSRISLDFSFYKASGDLNSFRDMWGYKSVLCDTAEEHLSFGSVLDM